MVSTGFTENDVKIGAVPLFLSGGQGLKFRSEVEQQFSSTSTLAPPVPFLGEDEEEVVVHGGGEGSFDLHTAFRKLNPGHSSASEWSAINFPVHLINIAKMYWKLSLLSIISRLLLANFLI